MKERRDRRRKGEGREKEGRRDRRRKRDGREKGQEKEARWKGDGNRGLNEEYWEIEENEGKGRGRRWK